MKDSHSCAGIQENGGDLHVIMNNPIRLERIEFKLINEVWVQINREVHLKKIKQ